MNVKLVEKQIYNQKKMKKIIIILLMSQFAKAQMSDDNKHIIAGAVISAGTAMILNKITHKPICNLIDGFIVGMASGYAKEYIWDRKLGNGVFNRNDYRLTTRGAFAGVIMVGLIIKIK